MKEESDQRERRWVEIEKGLKEMEETCKRKSAEYKLAAGVERKGGENSRGKRRQKGRGKKGAGEN